MSTTTCPVCGNTYTATEEKCPVCGCLNDKPTEVPATQPQSEILNIARRYMAEGNYDMAISLLTHSEQNSEAHHQLLKECLRAKEEHAAMMPPPVPPLPDICPPSPAVTDSPAQPAQNNTNTATPPRSFFDMLNLPVLVIFAALAPYIFYYLVSDTVISDTGDALTYIAGTSFGNLIRSTALALYFCAIVGGNSAKKVRILLVCLLGFGLLCAIMGNFIYQFARLEYQKEYYFIDSWEYPMSVRILHLFGCLSYTAAVITALVRCNKQYKIAVATFTALYAIILLTHIDTIVLGGLIQNSGAFWFWFAYALLTVFSYGALLSASLHRGKTPSDQTMTLRTAEGNGIKQSRIVGWIGAGSLFILCLMFFGKRTEIDRLIGLCVCANLFLWYFIINTGLSSSKILPRILAFSTAGLSLMAFLLTYATDDGFYETLTWLTSSIVALMVTLLVMPGFFWFMKVTSAPALRQWLGSGIVTTVCMVFGFLTYLDLKAIMALNLDYEGGRNHISLLAELMYGANLSTLMLSLCVVLPIFYFLASMAQPEVKQWRCAAATAAIGFILMAVGLN